jgi:hypothetical protein
MAQQERQDLRDLILQYINDNETGDITPADVRLVLNEILDSALLPASDAVPGLAEVIVSVAGVESLAANALDAAQDAQNSANTAQSWIGVLDELETTARTNLVASINEMHQQLVQQYTDLTQADVAIVESLNQHTADQNNPHQVTASQLSDFQDTVRATTLAGLSSTNGTPTTSSTVLQGFNYLRYLLLNFAAKVQAVALGTYTPATSSQAIAATDTPAVALGKLEYKATTSTTAIAGLQGRGGYFRGPWAAATDYKKYDEVVNPSSQLVYANADFTSGATYSAANWTAVPVGGSSGASAAGTALIQAADVPAERTLLGLKTVGADLTVATDGTVAWDTAGAYQDSRKLVLNVATAILQAPINAVAGSSGFLFITNGPDTVITRTLTIANVSANIIPPGFGVKNTPNKKVAVIGWVFDGTYFWWSYNAY